MTGNCIGFRYWNRGKMVLQILSLHSPHLDTPCVYAQPTTSGFQFNSSKTPPTTKRPNKPAPAGESDVYLIYRRARVVDVTGVMMNKGPTSPLNQAYIAELKFAEVRRMGGKVASVIGGRTFGSMPDLWTQAPRMRDTIFRGWGRSGGTSSFFISKLACSSVTQVTQKT